jgi:hypothetical protein
VSAYLWTAQRFGLTPGKVAARLAADGLPKVLCVSLPKAGTHLAERAVCLHPRLYRKILPTLNPQNIGADGLEGVVEGLRPGQVVLGHLPFDPAYVDLLRREGVRTLFVIRDPRDIAVSLAYYVAGRRDHPLHALYSARPDLRSRIELAVLGDGDARPPAPSLESILSGFAGWLESGALVVRFEDLIGPRGGGDREAQAGTVDAIYAHLELDHRNGLAGHVFSHASPTFRKGMIGQWRAHFDRALTSLIHRQAGPWIEAYGYG